VKASLGAVALAASIALGFGSASAAETSPAPIVVHIKDFKYAPTPIKIHVGDTVAFINDDDEAHTVTASDKSFDSEGLDSNKTWKHTFTKAGTFAYFCELHPYMKASIVVLPVEKSS
jgi:plastocyanin